MPVSLLLGIQDLKIRDFESYFYGLHRASTGDREG
jgi:hypothetical protein